MNELVRLVNTLVKTRDGFRVFLTVISMFTAWQTWQMDKRLAVVEDRLRIVSLPTTNSYAHFTSGSPIESYQRRGH
jgi:hypothetical protein